MNELENILKDKKKANAFCDSVVCNVFMRWERNIQDDRIFLNDEHKKICNIYDLYKNYPAITGDEAINNLNKVYKSSYKRVYSKYYNSALFKEMDKIYDKYISKYTNKDNWWAVFSGLYEKDYCYLKEGE